MNSTNPTDTSVGLFTGAGNDPSRHEGSDIVGSGAELLKRGQLMGTIMVNYMKDDRVPEVYSSPPHIDEDGDEQPARITVRPWAAKPLPTPDEIQRLMAAGQPLPDVPEVDDASVVMFFSVEEAELLARSLLEVVVAAKEGIYSERGVEIVKFMQKDALDQAWKALGLSSYDEDD